VGGTKRFHVDAPLKDDPLDTPSTHTKMVLSMASARKRGLTLMVFRIFLVM
jgi:hypothetical protein